MFIDASALTVLVTDEKEATELPARLQRKKVRVTSPLAVWESSLAVARILNTSIAVAETILDDFLRLARVDVIAVPPEAGGLALEAHRRFGKGRHPACLNFADCFAYACARHHGLPLMFKGGDFGQTDIEAG